jgi:hypothetical protein
MNKPTIFRPSSHSLFINPSFFQAAFIDPGTVSCAFRIVRYYHQENRIEVLYFGILNFGRKIELILSGVERELTPLIDLFINCHHIVIERQPLKRCDVYRTSQHIISYLSFMIKNKGVYGLIIEVDPKLKTSWIGGPATAKQNNGDSIKKWSQRKALEILHLRNDTFSLSILSSSLYKAREDLSDVVCYEYAWWSYFLTIKESV